MNPPTDPDADLVNDRRSRAARKIRHGRATLRNAWFAKRAPRLPSDEETELAGSFEIKRAREMQIAILVEQMRREGYEVMVSRPE